MFIFSFEFDCLFEDLEGSYHSLVVPQYIQAIITQDFSIVRIKVVRIDENALAVFILLQSHIR